MIRWQERGETLLCFHNQQNIIRFPVLELNISSRKGERNENWKFSPCHEIFMFVIFIRLMRGFLIPFTPFTGWWLSTKWCVSDEAEPWEDVDDEERLIVICDDLGLICVKTKAGYAKHHLRWDNKNGKFQFILVTFRRGVSEGWVKRIETFLSNPKQTLRFNDQFEAATPKNRRTMVTNSRNTPHVFRSLPTAYLSKHWLLTISNLVCWK